MVRFWQNWLVAWCIGVALVGLMLFGAGWPATDLAARAAFALLGSPLPIEPDRYLRFAISLMGAVTLGWAVTYYGAFRAAWALDPATATPIWRVLAVAAAIWYFIDSIASVANGFALNAVSNTLLMILFAIPLIASGVLKTR